MANFKTHVSFSTLLGSGYAGLGFVYGVPWDTALVAGGLCGLSGMLPDIDSDHGIPLRETMAFSAGILPMLLVDRFQAMELHHDTMVLLAMSLYFIVRFGFAKVISRLSVHRGMFHSIPAGLIFAGAAFLVCGYNDLNMRYFKAGAVFVGFLSHLLLDEIYSVDAMHFRIKKSFGTAMKFWGQSTWANLATYVGLFAVIGMILGEPTVMERLDARAPSIAGVYHQIHDQIQDRQFLPRGTLGQSRGTAANDLGPIPSNSGWGGSADPYQTEPAEEAGEDRTIYDTARRVYRQLFE
jgi:hypothetical protein